MKTIMAQTVESVLVSLFLFCCIASITTARPTPAVNYYVSCFNGSDANSGHSLTSPLATFEAVVQRLRRTCQTSKLQQNVLITALTKSSCTFELSETLYLNATLHCWTNISFVTYGSQKAILSGGISTLFSPQASSNARDGTHFVETVLPTSVFPHKFVWSLWYPPQNRQLSPSARLFPTTSPTLKYEKLVYPTPPTLQNGSKIYFDTQDHSSSPMFNISAQSPILNQMYVRIYHSWTSSVNRVHSWAPTTGVLTLEGILGDHFQTASGNRYALINYLQCDSPDSLSFAVGSFALCPLNATHRKIVARVPSNVTRLVVPRQSVVLKIQRSNVHFGPGFVFAHTVALVDETCLGGCGQSASALPSATIMTSLGIDAPVIQGIIFEGIEVLHTGSYAAWFGEGTVGLTVHRCLFEDLGAGGIRIGAPNGGKAANVSTMAQNILIQNSIIQHSGFVVEAGAGILLQQAKGCSIKHNAIRHLKYTGVSTGWTWNYSPTDNANNYVGFNLIHDIGQGILSDMGCIYNLGLNFNSMFENNLCYNVWSYGYGGWGLYSDQGSTAITWKDNIVYKTTGAAYHHHWGVNVTVFNNVFALPYSSARNWQSDKACFRTDPGTYGSTFDAERNICFQSNPNSTLFYGEPYAFRNANFNRNIYWNYDIATNKLVFPTNSTDHSFSTWQRLDGEDLNSLLQDPGFTNWKADDFSSMSPSSPAFKLGFRPINVTTVGPTNN